MILLRGHRKSSFFVSLELAVASIWIWPLSFLDAQSSVNQLVRPRGVSPSRLELYASRADKFTCLDNSTTIPYLQVNDDYCDCPDGSDEPGTPACPNGIFTCLNQGYIERPIPSSRVNDGLCDCCDGSDEFNGVRCSNICEELGAAWRAEMARKEKLFTQGYQLRQEYVQQARARKDQARSQIDEIKSQLTQIEERKNSAQALKQEREASEKEALDKWKAIEEEERRQKEEQEMRLIEERNQAEATEAFRILDSNSDGKITYQELQQWTKFDQNSDGVVSVDEAKFFLHATNEMDLEEFKTTGWVIMKPYYTKDQEPVTENLPTPPPTPDALPPFESEDIPVPEDDDIDEYEEDDKAYEPQPPKEEEEQPRQYDEVTQSLVDSANEAREHYNQIEKEFIDMENKVKESETLINTDYGPDDALMPLSGHCFEHTDREYTYKLCPFDRASQRPKDGGQEVNLGRWGHWVGSDGSAKYQTMKYDSGMTCWNGPPRSVVVNLHCGLENSLFDAGEPSRCEYAFDFETPAVCNRGSNQQQQYAHPTHPHEEL